MLKRFIFRLFLVGFFVTAGLCIGFLYAPAPGTETREKLSVALDQHKDSLGTLVTDSQEVLARVTAAASGTLNAAGDSEPSK
tara:strand:- start:54 stop:299 length:246 start_codon:yes stop_codon:yes gene_type:complete